MAGIEVASLLLAVLPLFISAAEHYKDGIGFVKKAGKKELFAAKYKEELIQQKALLILYIKGVVGRTELPPATQLMLIEDPTSNAWKAPQVTKQLAAELSEAYQPFLDTISRICKALARQVKDDAGTATDGQDFIQQLRNLCLERKQAAVPADKQSNLLDRIKFSWRSSQRDEILAELGACNRMLEKLSNAAERAKPFARRQEHRRVHAVYEGRGVMQRLFGILCNACKCQQAELQQIGLRLQVWTDEEGGDPESMFQIILCLSRGVICEISARIARTADCEPPKKKVRIFTAADNTSASGSTDSIPNKNMKVLEDICKEVTKARACSSCLELLVDKHEKVYCAALQQSPQSPSQPVVQQLLSLTDVMSQLQLYDQKRWLHKEKSILAVILAYSLVQLHDSPWQWNSDNIRFVDKGVDGQSRSGTGAHLHLRRPYTRSQVGVKIPPGAVNHAVPPRGSRRNAHIHALGVTLVELYLNRSIQNDVIASSSKNYRSTAQDLLEDHADDMAMTPEYLQAVRFCLAPHPNPCSGSFSFDDEGFREIYYREVLSMLEENLTSRFEVNEKVWLNAG